VQPIRIQSHMRAHGASAKEIHCTALRTSSTASCHASGMRPLNCDIHARFFAVKARVSRMAARIVAVCTHAPRPTARRLCLAVVLHNAMVSQPASAPRADHQPRGRRNHGHRIAERGRESSSHAPTGQRLGQRRVLQRDVIRYMERILCRMRAGMRMNSA